MVAASMRFSMRIALIRRLGSIKRLGWQSRERPRRKRKMLSNRDTMQLPLTAAQRAIWVAHHLDPNSPAYNIGHYTELTGSLNPELLAVATQQVVAQTESLRLRFYDSIQGPLQSVIPLTNWVLPQNDFSDEPDPLAAAEAWIQIDIAQPFNLTPIEYEPLFRWSLLCLSPQRWIWVQVYHHIISDGYSRAMITGAVAKCYSALVEGRPAVELEISSPLDLLLARDVTYRASQAWTQDRDYWLGLMNNPPEPVSLSEIGPVPSRRPRRNTRQLDPVTVSSLASKAGELGATLPQLIAAVAGIYVHRLTATQDIVIGMQVTGRLDSIERQTPFMLTNTLPLRLHIGPATSLAAVVGQTAHQLRAGMRRQRYRYEDLRHDLGIGPLSADLFSMVVNFQRFDYGLSFAGQPSKTHVFSSGPVEDLSLIIYELGMDAGLRFDLSGNFERYNPTALASHADRLCGFLSTIAYTTGETPLAQLSVVGPAERETVSKASTIRRRFSITYTGRACLTRR